ncbi:MAG: prepilin-type N-terminal cleavage/methylation domain-containing protein [Opitutaceae bacterium]|nr:prepilin-type N-terminal cleavage/methylation domain-containing protein [Opitutaceae bacterium]
MPITFGSRRLLLAAFTLVELLTVIAIIGILAAIIIPTVGKVKKIAQKATCVSNLRQLALVWLQETSERGGLIPIAAAEDPDRVDKGGSQHAWIDYLVNTWTVDTARNASIAKITRCPVQVAKKPALSVTAKTYSLNRDLNKRLLGNANDTWQLVRRRSMDTLQNPVRTALLADGNDDGAALNYYNALFGVGRVPDFVHDGVANVVFVDGHVESRKAEDPVFSVTSVPSNGGSPESIFWYGE